MPSYARIFNLSGGIHVMSKQGTYSSFDPKMGLYVKQMKTIQVS